MSESPETQGLMSDILSLLSQLSDQFEPGAQEMKQWMAEHFPNPAIIDLLQEATFTMMRVLDAIGSLEPVNGITISKQFRIPKGSVSKTTRRLIAQKLIVQESLPNNKKEVLFRLTPLGRELSQAHRAFDEQMERGFRQFMARYQADELRFVTRILRDALTTSFLNLGASPHTGEDSTSS